MNDNSTQIGIFNLPGNMAFPNDKVLKLFIKLKRRANAARSTPLGPGGESTPIREIELNVRSRLLEKYILQYTKNSPAVWP